jgi:hypothetical protein
MERFYGHTAPHFLAPPKTLFEPSLPLLSFDIVIEIGLQHVRRSWLPSRPFSFALSRNRVEDDFNRRLCKKWTFANNAFEPPRLIPLCKVCRPCVCPLSSTSTSASHTR